MKLSHLFTKTRREAPKDETARNAQLLIRAGFIYKELAGVYSFLPLGLRVLRNIETIVREEMDAIGSQELQLTSLQDANVWEASDRWSDQVMDVWFKTKLQNGTELGLAATHEEPLTRIAASYINSYKDLPFSAYQFQWKLRNELRAKSGIMRGREFRMKDMYSFAASQKQHDEFYAASQKAYTKVYDRLGIGTDTYFTYADGGSFSKFSHEYQTLLEVGEDTIYLDEERRVAINEEIIDNADVLKEIGTTKEQLRKVAAAEVGNIFPLGTKYSEALGAHFTAEDGTQHPVVMGSYGIGVSRLVGVLAEYFADNKGLVWPEAVAPFQVHLVRLGDGADVAKAADKLYHDLQRHQVSVLYDDRDESAGAKFADADLIGCPIRLTISPKTLDKQSVEFQRRTESEAQLIPLTKILDTISPK